MKNKTLPNLVLALSIASSAAVVNAREYISIVGSSTVYPFSTVVAERFGKFSDFATPKIESTGSGGGMKLFCSGVGTEYPDITNASRRIKKSELEDCLSNGVEEVIEVQIGFDGIVLANSVASDRYHLSLRDIYLALAAKVPNPDGSESLVTNPYKTWKQLNAALPDVAIEVIGPPPTSGTRDAFSELALEGGCETFHWIEAMKKTDKSAYKQICRTVREDGPFVEAGENDNLIVQKLNANPEALGVFGFSFLDQNADKVQGATIEGNEPEFETIADKSYPVSRPLFFYVKKAHIGVVPGIEGFLKEFTADKAWGEEGYLADKGMISLDDELRGAYRDNVKNKIAMGLDELH